MHRNPTNTAIVIGVVGAALGGLLILLPEFVRWGALGDGHAGPVDSGLRANLRGYGIFLAAGGLMVVGMALWRRFDSGRSAPAGVSVA